MALFAAKACRKESLNQFPCIGDADNLAAETDDIQVIVLNALVRGKRFMNQAGANSNDLIGRHVGADPAAANGDAAVHIPGSDRPGQRNHEIRIVIVRLQAVGAKVDHMMTGFAQEHDKLLLQFKTTMVCSDANDF